MSVWDIMYEALVHIENMPSDIFDEDDQIRSIASAARKRANKHKEANKIDKALLALHRGLLIIAVHPVGIGDAAPAMVQVAKSALQKAEN
jgi:hypothetical protein